MASYVLYPPIIDSYMSAFQANKKDVAVEKPCRIYFTLSNFNSIDDVSSVQAVIKYQSSNLSAVNPVDDNGTITQYNRYRQTGIILNIVPERADENNPNLFYFDLYNKDLNGNRDINTGEDNSSSDYCGWLPGQIYTIQIRLSDIKYYGEYVSGETQSEWLSTNASHFSEWSTICILKVVGHIKIQIPIMDFDSDIDDPLYTRKTLFLSTLDIDGNFVSDEDSSERLYSYRIKIYKGVDSAGSGIPLEDSGTLYSNQFHDVNEFKYLSKLELDDLEYYTVIFDFVTNNDYNFTTKIIFQTSLARIDEALCELYYLGSDEKVITPSGIEDSLKGISTLDEEEEEGRIALKIVSNNMSNVPYYGSFYIRRTSSKDNYLYWEDIFLITLKGVTIESLEPIYDYTIESGVFYKYGIQSVDTLGNRGVLAITNTPTLRNFNFSYLLGQNNQQLKLMFDNTMNNYKIQLSESKSETIGNRYPKVVRNNAVYYKIFPINGLISYLMDPNNLFCTDEDLYNGDKNLAEAYKQHNMEPEYLSWDADYNGLIETGSQRTLIDYNTGLPILDNQGNPVMVSPAVDFTFPAMKENLGSYPVNYGPSSDNELKGKIFSQYDYIHEKDFRNKVLDFLYNGQPKLFKSPTEGNVIVRLMDINCVPVQSLDRMLYSFASNGNEIADNTIENYKKYKFINIGDLDNNLYTEKTKIGQLQMDFDAEYTIGSTIIDGTNIIEEIYNKHHRMLNNYGGYQSDVKRIHHIRITIDEKPLRIEVKENTDSILTLGNQISVGKAADPSSNREIITVYNTMQTYEFDNRLTFNEKDDIHLINAVSPSIKTVRATVDYLYDVIEQPYVGRIVSSKKFIAIPGQYYEETMPDTQIDLEIKKKYSYNWSDSYRKINNFSTIEIQAIPNSVFEIRDSSDSHKGGVPITHVMNETGTLNLHRISGIISIKYIGWYKKTDTSYELITNKAEIPSTNIMVNYHCTLETGTYVD